MRRIGVLHITDTLEAGGAERVAVNLVNLLPRERYQTNLCTTRRDGPLADLVAEDVGRLRLDRKRRFDSRALRSLVAFIRARDIQLLHAHSTSLFMASMASLFPPFPAVVWHDHFGEPLEQRSVWLDWPLVRHASGVIVVSQPLLDWAGRHLAVPADRVWYVPNFVCEAQHQTELPNLPGVAGQRIACVANLRTQKDQLTLLKAMALVVREVPTAHLLLIGAARDPAYLALIENEIALRRLKQSVSLLGERADVPAILNASDIGVLSSIAEGLPLALIEYGIAGLPVVATQVGQCADVLDNGEVGILVPPGSPEAMAQALLSLLGSSDRRANLARVFWQRTREKYNVTSSIKQVCRVYELVLASRQGRG
jgi:glycosyltransferase involved in cell wall biosynthesis